MLMNGINIIKVESDLVHFPTLGYIAFLPAGICNLHMKLFPLLYYFLLGLSTHCCIACINLSAVKLYEPIKGWKTSWVIKACKHSYLTIFILRNFHHTIIKLSGVPNLDS